MATLRARMSRDASRMGVNLDSSAGARSTRRRSAFGRGVAAAHGAAEHARARNLGVAPLPRAPPSTTSSPSRSSAARSANHLPRRRSCCRRASSRPAALRHHSTAAHGRASGWRSRASSSTSSRSSRPPLFTERTRDYFFDQGDCAAPPRTSPPAAPSSGRSPPTSCTSTTFLLELARLRDEDRPPATAFALVTDIPEYYGMASAGLWRTDGSRSCSAAWIFNPQSFKFVVAAGAVAVESCTGSPSDLGVTHGLARGVRHEHTLDFTPADARAALSSSP